MGSTSCWTARLAPGDGWRAKLFAWLDICDAAVILFSEEALASDWVRFEAGILCWRRARTGRPLVVPVLLGQVSPDAPRRHALEPVLPEEIQAVPIAAEADEAELQLKARKHLRPDSSALPSRWRRQM